MMSYPTPLLLLVASAAAQASSTGNCVTGRMTFDPLRMYALGFDGAIPDLDAAKYDFTIDYGAVNTRVLDPIGVTTTLARTGNFGDGARISTVRYMQYGKLTARLKAAAVGGLVTTFITMSKSKDEIDWEIVGGDKENAQSNVFYQGIAEFGIHGGTHAVPSGVDQFHTYSIDWKSTSIVFSIDGRVVRTYNNDANAVSPMTPRGQRWYPTTPSQVQFSVWDGCKAGNNGTCGWSGGPITWTGNAYQSEFEYLDIQCYDDKNQEVPKWPASSPSRQDADATQPTSAAGPLANTGSGAGVYGSATVPVGDANSQTPSLVVIGALALFSLVAVL